MQTYNLVDIWRILHPNHRDYTFYSNRHKTFSRIDLLLISQSIAKNIINTEIHPIIISDHGPVSLKLTMSQFRQWRINISLFDDSEIRQQTKNYIF